MKALKIVKVTPALEFEVKTAFFKDFHKIIGGGCDIVETVHCRGLASVSGMENVVLLCDEEFLLRDHPAEINLLGSVLYGTQYHGHPILGTVLFVGDDGGEFRSLTEFEIGKLREWTDRFRNAPKGYT